MALTDVGARLAGWRVLMKLVICRDFRAQQPLEFLLRLVLAMETTRERGQRRTVRLIGAPVT